MMEPPRASTRRVLVTGGTGFVGREVLPRLVAHGWETHALTCRSSPPPVAGVTWHRGDLLDRDVAEQTVGLIRPHALMHLAWYVAPGQWPTALENLYWVDASIRLIRAFHENGGRRVVVAGSGLEYDWTYGYCSESRTPCTPHTVYGTAKHALHLLLESYARQTGLSLAWPRIFFLYGPHEHPARLVPTVVQSLLKGKRARCSHGRQIRDYLFVGDVADACVRLLESDVEGPINIASGEPITLRALATRAGELIGRPELIEFGAVSAAATDVPLVVADITRLSSELAWSPSMSLDQGLEATVAWWQRQLNEVSLGTIMTRLPAYSIVIPTYRRADMLAKSLESVCSLNYPLDALEIVIVDNAGHENTAYVAAPFKGRVHLRYLVNRRNGGYGYSVNRGIVASRGHRILLLNDDAMPEPDLLTECDRLLASSPGIGAVGCRAIEAGYQTLGDEIGRIGPRGEVHGNFNIDCGAPIDVDHVYGFCYVFTRQAVELAGLNDRTLLARRYSSGNRIETDHCLMIRRAGLGVVYNPRMSAVHLAKPRSDMSEVSLAWARNAIRNTLYLYLKHYGLFGKQAAALRLTFLAHVGLLSMVRRPSGANVAYFVNGLRARASAYGHYLLYLSGAVSDRPERLREMLTRDEDGLRRGEEAGQGQGAAV